MAVNGKAKGNGFERKIANLLSTRFQAKTGIESGFRRNPDSGSFFGGTNKKRTETYDLDYAVFGDLICPKNFSYSIECKNYKSAPSFQSVINHKVTQWDTWLKQANQDAESSKKLLAMIVKYNNVDEIVFIKHLLPINAHYIMYQEYYVYKLSDFLSCDDTLFFS